MARSCSTYPEFLLGDEDAGSPWADEGVTVYVRADLDPFAVFAEHFDEWAWPYGPGAPALVLMARDPFESPAAFSRVGDPGAVIHGDPHWSVEVDAADDPQDCAAYWRIEQRSPVPPRLSARLALPVRVGETRVFDGWPGERWQVETVHVADDLRDAKCTLLRMCDGTCNAVVLDAGRCDGCGRPAVELTPETKP